MESDDLALGADGSDVLLRATSGLCDTGYGWVNTTLVSSLASKSPEDVRLLYDNLLSENADLSASAYTKEHDRLREDLSALASASVTVHEETHFYQLISTPYGRLASEIERYWLHDARDALTAIVGLEREPADAVPLREWVSAAAIDEGSPLRCIQARYIEIAYTQSHALRAALNGTAFQGFAGYSVDDLTIGDALDAWPQFLMAQDRAENADDTGDVTIKQDGHPSSLVTNLSEQLPSVPVINGSKITPRAILEGAAHEIQFDWIRSQLGDVAHLPLAMRVLNPAFGDDTYLRTRRLVDAVMKGLEWPRRRQLLLILSDLALWGATHRGYVGDEDRPVAWEDLNPGYRFVRALQAVGEQAQRLGKSGVADRATVTEAVCDNLGWAQPQQMAQNMLGSLQIERTAGTLAEDTLWPWRQRAAQARLAAPDVFIDATDEHDVHSQFNLVMPFMVERGHARMQNDRASIDRLVRATAAHLSRSFLDGRGSRLFDEPENASNMVHDAATEILFSRAELTGLVPRHSQAGATKPQRLNRADRRVATGASTKTQIPGTAEALLEGLSAEGMDDYVRSLRTALIYRRIEVEDWFLRQPAVAESVLALREFRPDGGFTISWPAVWTILRRSVEMTEPGALRELFEDCGMWDLGRDLERFQNRTQAGLARSGPGNAHENQPSARSEGHHGSDLNV